MVAKGKKVDPLRFNMMYLCVALRRVDIAKDPLADALKRGWDERDIKRCLLTLYPKHWHKTMPSKSRPGTLMDAYRRRFEKVNWYIKTAFVSDKKRGLWLVVTSFKEK